MNEQYKNEQIKKFLADAGMSNAVRQFIIDVFLEKRNHQDIYMAGAERIAVDLLVDAFKKMDTIRNMDTFDKKKSLSHV